MGCNSLTPEARPSCALLPLFPEPRAFPVWLLVTHATLCLVQPRAVLPLTGTVLSLAFGSFRTHVLLSSLLHTAGELLYVSFSPPGLCAGTSSHLGLPAFSILSPQLREPSRLSLGCPSLLCSLKTCSSELGNCKGSAHWFLTSQESLSFVAQCPGSENCCFTY